MIDLSSSILIVDTEIINHSYTTYANPTMQARKAYLLVLQFIDSDKPSAATSTIASSPRHHILYD
jgi:hypothetical protein